MLNSIFYEGTFNIESVAIALAVSLIIGLFISGLYRFTSEEAGKFAIVLAVMPLLVTSIIMIVNGNLGTSVAVLGAFGLVRFRSAQGSAWEIIFLFFSMAVGLALGMGFISLAILITVVTGAILFVLEKMGYDRKPLSVRELKITIPEDLNYSGIFDDIFKKYASFFDFYNVRTTNMGTMYELCYRIKLKNDINEKEMIDAIRCKNGNLTVSLGYAQKEHNLL